MVKAALAAPHGNPFTPFLLRKKQNKTKNEVLNQVMYVKQFSNSYFLSNENQSHDKCSKFCLKSKLKIGLREGLDKTTGLILTFSILDIQVAVGDQTSKDKLMRKQTKPKSNAIYDRVKLLLLGF